MKQKSLNKLAVVFITLACVFCQSKYPTLVPYEQIFELNVLKWYEGHRATVSLTYDAPWSSNLKVQETFNEVVKRNLCMDFELVTGNFDRPESQNFINQMRNELMPMGIHFFGHGHLHIDHDAVSFDSAYCSFKKCYDLMSQWGLCPRAYAYPYNKGNKETTQLACKLAGFICARGVSFTDDKFYICPNETKEPNNWYFLPAIPVAHEYQKYVQNHQKLVPLLNTAIDSSAWVIIMYHSIGIDIGWGYYPFEDFLQDLDLIAAGDFWCANFDMAAAYVQERNNFRFENYPEASEFGNWKYYIIFRDNLDNEIYNQPLTLEFNFNTNLHIKKMLINPAVESKTEFQAKDNKIRLNIIPDEKRYLITIQN